MEKKYDVTALGELLIDFTQSGISEQGNPLLEANPGGAVCNVLSMLTKLDKKTAFIGKVGNDGFGHQLEKAIKEQGIETKGLKFDDQIHTTLAIVTKTETGDRDFSFYRNPGADISLTEEEVDEDIIKNSRMFHFGSLSLTDEPVRSATKKALRLAKENNLLISFDPNLREPLWGNLDEAHKQIEYGLKQCDILKISDNEIIWFTGKDDFDEGVKYLREHYPQIKLLCLSMGSDGSRAYYKDFKVEYHAFLHDGPIETTGCGDTFCGSIINTVLEKGIDNLDEESLKEMLRFANGAASLVAIKKGALRVMPEKHKVLHFINKGIK